MTHIEAMKQALEALKSSNKLINGTGTKFGLAGAMDGYYSGCFDVEGNNKLLTDAITAIEEALAQPAVAEQHKHDPVSMLKLMMEESAWEGQIKLSDALLNIEQFYTTPPQSTWVKLTDEEMTECIVSICNTDDGTGDTRNLIRAVESKLKEKNT